MGSSRILGNIPLERFIRDDFSCTSSLWYAPLICNKDNSLIKKISQGLIQLTNIPYRLTGILEDLFPFQKIDKSCLNFIPLFSAEMLNDLRQILQFFFTKIQQLFISVNKCRRLIGILEDPLLSQRERYSSTFYEHFFFIFYTIFVNCSLISVKDNNIFTRLHLFLDAKQDPPTR